MRLLFLPLDSRPTSRVDPVDLGRLAGIRVHGPPLRLLGTRTRAAPVDRLLDWAARHRPGADGLLVHAEMPLYGGLIPSRDPATPVAQARSRLGRLAELARQVPTHVAASILRQSITVSSSADLILWKEIHRVFGCPARERHRELCRLRDAGRGDLIDAILACRARNQALNLELVELQRAGVFRSLVFLQEDCSPGGVLAEEVARLRDAARGVPGISFQVGTDEGGMLLVARAVRERFPGPLPVRVVWGDRSLADGIPPYEDRPIGRNLEEKADYLGLERVEVGDPPPAAPIRATLHLHGRAPVIADAAFEPVAGIGGDGRGGWPRGHPLLDPESAEGVGRVLVDLAAVNGGDPALLDLPSASKRALLGYAGWNTAGNTLGCALAQLVCRVSAPRQREAAGMKHVLRRWLDDLVYLSRVRHRVRAGLHREGIDPHDFGPGAGRAAALLAQEARAFAVERDAFLQIGRSRSDRPEPPRSGILHRTPRGRVRVFDAGVRARYPWGRDFEIDLRLTGRWSDR